MVCVVPPAVAVMASGKEPVFAPEAAAIFSVLLWLPPPEKLAGEKVAVTPAGKPLSASVTGELNPPVSLTVTLKAELVDRLMATDEALSVTEKPGPVVTAIASETVLLTPPPDAVTRMV